MDEENGIAKVNGKSSSKKRRSKRRKVLVNETWQDFASSTTLHGLGYIARRGVATIEKIFWLITFCVSVGICVYQIRNVWDKWVNSPVIVSISEELVPVSDVPFPSVTICPQWKVYTEKFKYATEKNKLRIEYNGYYQNDSNISNETRKKFEDVTLICDKALFNPDYFMLLDRNYSNIQVVENIREASDEHLEALKRDTVCSWQKEYVPCSVLKKVYTQEGLCFNFNGMDAKDIFRQEEIQPNYSYIETREERKGWSIEDGYDGAVNDPYPRRGRQNGAEPDLLLTFLDYQEALDKECNGLHTGYKVYIQHPADMPQSSLYYYALMPEQTTSLAIKYSVVSASYKLKDYSVEIRRCYFADERYLRYFQIYTENNCRMECLSNYTYSMCGCVGFFMPHHTTDRICTIQSTACMETALEQLAKKETPDTNLDPKRCNCLPLCNNVEYDADTLKTEYNAKHYLAQQADTDFEKEFYSHESYSKLEMYFKSPRFVSMRRSELFGTTDFIANCGGLLGLFLGFSFLSIIEIIYFITLRLWCSFKKDSEAEKQEQ